MANIKSQIKRNRQNEQARVRNKSVRSALKTYARRVRESVAAGDQ
ncbi:MAG TPA: 30S ribosomal protein S20, partial [Actinomycetota bacterium]|nr:30S ribosomal protein S20 [Actinomycetota bacterium]